MKGLTASAREKEGKKGGVQKIIFICAAVMSEGFEHKPQAFFEVDVGFKARYMFPCSP